MKRTTIILFSFFSIILGLLNSQTVLANGGKGTSEEVLKRIERVAAVELFFSTTTMQSLILGVNIPNMIYTSAPNGLKTVSALASGAITIPAGILVGACAAVGSTICQKYANHLIGTFDQAPTQEELKQRELLEIQKTRDCVRAEMETGYFVTMPKELIGIINSYIGDAKSEPEYREMVRQKEKYADIFREPVNRGAWHFRM